MGERKYTVDGVREKLSPLLDGIIRNGRFRLSFQIVPGDAPHPEIEDPDVIVRFGGPDVDLLLENRAEVLLAMEQIAMEALRIPPDEHVRLRFDANDYRMLRIEELRLSALTAAERVKQTRTPFHFSPMSSRERRILHLALREETAVRSESGGLGPHRHVVIYPAGMPSAPSPAPPPPQRGRRRR